MHRLSDSIGVKMTASPPANVRSLKFTRLASVANCFRCWNASCTFWGELAARSWSLLFLLLRLVGL